MLWQDITVGANESLTCRKVGPGKQWHKESQQYRTALDAMGEEHKSGDMGFNQFSARLIDNYDVSWIGCSLLPTCTVIE